MKQLLLLKDPEYFVKACYPWTQKLTEDVKKKTKKFQIYSSINPSMKMTSMILQKMIKTTVGSQNHEIQVKKQLLYKVTSILYNNLK